MNQNKQQINIKQSFSRPVGVLPEYIWYIFGDVSSVFSKYMRDI